jgi:hypothetical protein
MSEEVKKKHPGGRPKIYNADELAEQLHDFIDENEDPQIIKFLLPRDKPCHDHLLELAKNCRELSEAITRAKNKCAVYLTSPECAIHPKIAGIRLATNHGMAERIQQELTGANGGAIEINVSVGEE